MKIKNGFMIREVAGQWVVVPLGERVVDFNGIMTLSESGALLWKALEQDTLEEDLVAEILKEYEVDKETAKNDVLEFIATLKEKNIIECSFA